MEKIKVLGLMDYGCSTGFATVASNIMMELDKTGRFDLTIIGVNFDPASNYDPARFPGRIIPAITVSNLNAPDPYGRQRLLDELGTGQYDILFSIQDTFIIQTIIKQIIETHQALPKKFSSILYYPIDASPKKDWIEEVVANIDFPVPYTKYARDETLKIAPNLVNKLQDPIYHGTNLTDFYPLEQSVIDEFRHNYFAGKADNRFLITNVNRNQPRKDIIRNFMILNELRQRGDKDSILYLHMAHEDTGGNILVMADHFNFKLGEDYILPSPQAFTVNQGMPIEIINHIYNASDMLLTTTLGEGWGLSITEAMATKLPIVAPDNTSLSEMLADNRGLLVPSGETANDWIMKEPDNERLRPIMDIFEAADHIETVKSGVRIPDIDKAYDWAIKYSWKNICKEWVKVFDKAYNHANLKTQATTVTPNRATRRDRKRNANIPL